MGNSNEFTLNYNNEIIPYLSPNSKVLLGPGNKSTLNVHAGKTTEVTEDNDISFRNQCH